MIPAHFICWNHFYSFLGSDPRPGNQEVRAAGDSPYSFSTEPLFLIPSWRDRRQGSQEIRLAGMHRTFFRGNQFSSFLPAGTASPGSQEIGLAGMHRTFFQKNHFSSFLPAGTAALEARRSGSPGCTALFFKGTTFPHSLCFTDAVGRTRLSPAVLPLALRRKEIAEFWQYGKRARRCSESFRQHPDTVLAKVA
jgi:hypothetical protein